MDRKSARCRFTFKRLDQIPVCQSNRLIVSSKNLHQKLQNKYSR
jgi:hypothetical protein